MSIIKVLGLIILSYSIQTTVLSVITFKGVMPDIILIILVYFSLHMEKEKGLSLGFILGILQDCLSAGPIGINALLKGIAGFVIGNIRGKLLSENLLTRSFFTLAADIFNSIGSILLYKLFLGERLHTVPVEIIIYSAAYTTIFSLFFMPFIEWLCINKKRAQLSRVYY